MTTEDIRPEIRPVVEVADALSKLRMLSGAITDFTREAGAGSKQLGQWNKELLHTLNSSGNFVASTGIAKTSVQNFADSLEKGKLSFGQYVKYGIASAKGFSTAFKQETDTVNKYAIERVKQLQTHYTSLGKTIEGTNKVIKIAPTGLAKGFATDMALATQKTQIFNKVLDEGTKHLINWGKNTQWAGRQIMVGFTVPLLLASSKVKQIFADLEKESIRFRRVYGDMFTKPADTERALADIKDLAKEMTKYGVTVAQTIKMSADAAAAGKQNAELRASVAEAIRLSVLGEVDQQEALTTSIALQSAYKISAEQLAEAIDYLNAVENQSVLSIQDVTEAIPRLGPIVQQLGGDIKDTTVFLAAMRESGISAEQGANALKSGLASLINPTKRGTEALAEFGININKMVKDNEGNLMGMVTEFATSIDTLTGLQKQQVLEKVFGKFQYAKIGALLDNITEKGSQANQVLELAQQSALSLAALSAKELMAVEDSPVSKLAKAFENFRNTVAPIGKYVTESMARLVSGFDNAINRVAGFVDKFKPLQVLVEGIGKAFSWTGIVLPTLVMGAGLAATFAGNLIKIGTKSMFAIQHIFGLNKEIRYLSREELNAQAAAASMEGKMSMLTESMLLQKSALQQLVQVLTQYRNAAAAAVPTATARSAKFTTLVGARKFARGGTVPGSGRGDTVPAMLEPQETVMNRSASQRFGPILAAMNAGTIKGFAKGTPPEDFSGPYTSSMQRTHLSASVATTIDKLLEKFKDSMADGVRRQLEILKAHKEIFHEVSLVSNLVAEMPAAFNNRLRDAAMGTAAPVKPTEFIDMWSAVGIDKWDVPVKLIGQNFDDVAGDLAKLDVEIMKLATSFPDGITDANLPVLIDQAFTNLITEAKATGASFGTTMTSLRNLGTELNTIRIKLRTEDEAKLRAAGYQSSGGRIQFNETIGAGNPKRLNNAFPTYKSVETKYKSAMMQNENGAMKVIGLVPRVAESISEGMLRVIKESQTASTNFVNNVIREVNATYKQWSTLKNSVLNMAKSRLPDVVPDSMEAAPGVTGSKYWSATSRTKPVQATPSTLTKDNIAIALDRSRLKYKQTIDEVLKSSKAVVYANLQEKSASDAAAAADRREAGIFGGMAGRVRNSQIVSKVGQSAKTGVLSSRGENSYGMFKLAMASDMAAMVMTQFGGKVGEFGGKLMFASTALMGFSALFGGIKNSPIGKSVAQLVTGFAKTHPVLTGFVAAGTLAVIGFKLLSKKTTSLADKLEADGIRIGAAMARQSNAVEDLFLKANIARRGTSAKEDLTGTSFEAQSDIFDSFKIDASFKGFADATKEGATEIFKAMNMFKMTEADLKVVLASMSKSIGEQTGRSAKQIEAELTAQLIKVVAPDNTDLLKDPLKITAEITKLGGLTASDDKIKYIGDQIAETQAQFEKIDANVEKSKSKLNDYLVTRAKIFQLMSQSGNAGTAGLIQFDSKTEEIMVVESYAKKIDGLSEAIALYNRQVLERRRNEKDVVESTSKKMLIDEQQRDLMKSIVGQQKQLNDELLSGAIEADEYASKSAKLQEMYEQLTLKHNKFVSSLGKEGLEEFRKSLEDTLKMRGIEVGDGSQVSNIIKSLEKRIFDGKSSERIKTSVMQAFIDGMSSDTILSVADKLFASMGESAIKVFEKTPTLLNNLFAKVQIDPTFSGDFRDLMIAVEEGRLDPASIDIITRYVLEGKAMGTGFEKILSEKYPEIALKIKAVMEGVQAPDIAAKNPFAGIWGSIKDTAGQYNDMADAATKIADAQISVIEDAMKDRLEAAADTVAKGTPGIFTQSFKKHVQLSNIKGVADLGKAFQIKIPKFNGGNSLFTLGKTVEEIEAGTRSLNERMDELASAKIPIQKDIDDAADAIDKLNKKLDESLTAIDNMFTMGTSWKKFGDQVKATFNSVTKLDTLNGKETSPVRTPKKESTFTFKAPKVPKLNVEDMVNWKPVGAAKFAEAFKLPPEVMEKAKEYIKIFQDAEKVGGVGAGLKAWEAIGEEVNGVIGEVEAYAEAMEIAMNIETDAVEKKFEKLGENLNKNWFGVVTELGVTLGDGEVQAAFSDLYNSSSNIFDKMQGSFEDAAKGISDAADASADEVEKRYEGAANAITDYFDGEIKKLEDSFNTWEKQVGRDWDAATTQIERDWDDATKQIEDGYEAIRDAAENSFDAQVEAAEAAFDAETEAAEAAFDVQVNLAKKAQEAEQKALSKQQRAEQKAFDKSQSKKRKQRQKEMDVAMEDLEAQFQAEIDAANELENSASGDADAGKQQRLDSINEAYDLQLEALKEISDYQQYITDQQKSQVDLASAISKGDIAGAAKVRADMEQRASEYQAGRTEKQIEKAKEAAIKAVEAEYDARGSAEKTSNNAMIEGIEARKKAAIEALEAQQEAEMEAFDDQQDLESEALDERQEAEMDALRERQDAEIDAMQQQHEKVMEDRQKQHETKLATMRTEHEAAMAAMQEQQDTSMENRSRQHEDDMQRRSLAHEDEMEKIRLAHEAKVTAIEGDKEVQLAALETAKEFELTGIQDIEDKRLENLKKLETAVDVSLKAREEAEKLAIQAAYDKIIGPTGPLQGYKDVEAQVGKVTSAIEKQNTFLATNLKATIDQQIKDYETLRLKAEERLDHVTKEETAIKGMLDAISKAKGDIDNFSAKTIAAAEAVNKIDQDKIDGLNDLKDKIDPDSALNRLAQLQNGAFPELPASWMALLQAAGVDISGSGGGTVNAGASSAVDALVSTGNNAMSAVGNAGRQEGDSQSRAPASLQSTGSSGGGSLKSRFTGGAASLLPQSHDGLNSVFREKVENLLSNFPGTKIHSAFRPAWYQQKLWDNALKKYGSPEAARKWVAPPGRSMHQSGLAMDLSYTRGEGAQVRANAGRFGLKFPMSWEPWHIEDSSTRGGGPTPADEGGDVDEETQSVQYDTQALAQAMIKAMFTGKFPELAEIPMVGGGGGSNQTGAFIGPVTPDQITGTRTGGSVSWRGNNPGNIRPGDFATSAGAIGIVSTEKYGNFAKFPNYQTGWNAMRSLLLSNSYRNLSIRDAIFRWAPPADHNNSESYAAEVSKAVGAPSGTKVGQLTPQQLLAMMEKIKKIEGWIPGVQMAANGAFVKASNGGSPFIVGEGGKDEIISPIDKMYDTVKRALKDTYGNIANAARGSNMSSTPDDDLKRRLLELEKKEYETKLQQIQKAKELIIQQIQTARANGATAKTVDDLKLQLLELDVETDNATAASKRNREALIVSMEQLAANTNETYRATLTTLQNTAEIQYSTDTMAVNSGSQLAAADGADRVTLSLDEGLLPALDGAVIAVNDTFIPTIGGMVVSGQLFIDEISNFAAQTMGISQTLADALAQGMANNVWSNGIPSPYNPGGNPGYAASYSPPDSSSVPISVQNLMYMYNQGYNPDGSNFFNDTLGLTPEQVAAAGRATPINTWVGANGNGGLNPDAYNPDGTPRYVGGGLPPGLNRGGFVKSKYLSSGGPIGSDTVPAMLTLGEFVVNNIAARKFAPLLTAINSGIMPSLSGFDPGLKQSANNNLSSSVYHIQVNVETGADADEIGYAVQRQISRSNDRHVKGYNR
jgi:hypothetical protein